ncbi:hypothetical protein NC797_06855 [Aquibacillus sp. 3ASR75-11]|uniref:Uncharacterized protein n=1 Tax=Terrihalobacillus insolitus TaxID=2950438 RepID=A0A9X4ALG6_9BACI|nr:hypothetical protein [Terrihalobacillus insolitus]MDC3424226.1 hypothetical protein [Terrihalobacillus insolitus]
MGILEVARENKLNLEEAKQDELVREHLHNLIQKGLVEQRWHKYRLIKNYLL